MKGRSAALTAVAFVAVVALAALGTLRWASAGSLLGDVNCGGTVNSIDAALVLQLDAGLIASLNCPQNADVNEDGNVNSLDAALILQFDAGLIDNLAPTATPVPPTSTPTSTSTATPTPGAQGDVNCDGLVNLVDALFILQFDAGQRRNSGGCPLPPPPPDTLHVAAGDVSKDGSTNVVDARFIFQCEVGIANSFCP